MKKAKITIKYNNSTTTFIKDYYEDCLEEIKQDIINSGLKVKKLDKKLCIFYIKYPNGNIEEAFYMKKRIEYNDGDEITHLNEDDFIQNNQRWFTYFVKCKDGSLYAGVTTDPIKRERQHNGEIVGGAKYTQSKRPCKMVYLEENDSRITSSQREYVIRNLTKKSKEKLILESNFLEDYKKNLLKG